MTCTGGSCNQGRSTCTDQCDYPSWDWVSTILLATYYVLALAGLCSISFCLGYAWVLFN
jgi:hypothetical protein